MVPDDAARDAGPEPGDAARDAGPPDAPGRWPQLVDYPLTEPVRAVALPARPDVPRFAVGGPTIVGDVAIVSSSQFGFAAIDWRRGALVWARPAGLHVAPPLAHGGNAILIGDCLNPPDASDTLLGCLRVITAAGDDQFYAAIHGKKLDEFATSPGPQAVWPDGERAVRWRRGDLAVTVDLFTGLARPARPEPPPVHVVYRDRAWDIAHEAEHIVARQRGKIAWQTRRAYTALVGAVYLADFPPMIRVANLGVFGERPEVNVFDFDATGSLNSQAAFPTPGISLLGHAIDDVGNTAIAVRMDTTLHHDFLAGYAANARLLYVYPLPEIPRADPVGVAIATDAVLVFHDGDTLTVLPPLSTPPTSPGSPRAPSKNPTP